MLFVTLMKARPGKRNEATARRLEWKYPEGIRVVGEYWLMSEEVSSITIAEADSIAPAIAAMRDWNDLFEISMVPAISAEDGMKLAKQVRQ